MARQLDPATRDALVERVRFYRDLGLTEFYRRPVDAAMLAAELRLRQPSLRRCRKPSSRACCMSQTATFLKRNLPFHARKSIPAAA